MITDRGQTQNSGNLYQVCWKSVVGQTMGRGRPVPRNVADFMARDESLANPLRSYWIEQYAPEVRRAN